MHHEVRLIFLRILATLTVMKLMRLRGRKICDHLMRKGSVWKGKHLSVRFLPSAPKHPAVNPSLSALYIGTVASTKLDKSAVKRNRMRRRCREAFRITLKETEKSGVAQLLILPRSSSLTCAFPELVSDVRAFLSVLPSWPNKAPDNSSNSR